MQRSICLRSLLEKACLSLLLICLLPYGATARAEAKAIDVLPGAFGESIDTLDDATSGLCIEYADLALQKLLEDFALDAVKTPRDAYLQILQTTLLLPGSLPPGANDIERAIWAEIYAGAACVVSFVALDNSLNVGGISYAEVTGRFGDYVVRQDGSVESISLRAIRSRFFADPIVPGVRVINMGSHYNMHYTLPASTGMNGAKPLDSGSVNNIRLGQLACITIAENQTTPYRWLYRFSDDTMMECVYDEYISDSNPLRMTGVGGKHKFYFKATGTGECSIDMHSVRIGEDIEKSVQDQTYAMLVAE